LPFQFEATLVLGVISVMMGIAIYLPLRFFKLKHGLEIMGHMIWVIMRSILTIFLRHDIEADLSRPMSLSHCGLSPLNVSISVIPL